MARLLEKVFKLKPVPNYSKHDEVPVSRPGNSLLDEIFENSDVGDGIDIGAINEFRTLASDRESQYKAYDTMIEDSTIASAIELYADDATQYNKSGKVIWAESEDPDINKFANGLITKFQLNSTAWDDIYNLCLYGDIYYKLFDRVNNTDEKSSNSFIARRRNNKSKNVFEEKIERMDNPAEFFDLVKDGKTVGFIHANIDELESNNNIIGFKSLNQTFETSIEDSRRYIHISLGNNNSRHPEKLKLNSRDKDGNEITKEYKIKRGKSILHDVYKTYRELQLLEDSLLLNRLTRSSIIRLLQVEVGDMPKSEVNKLLKRIKNLIEQKNVMNKEDGTFKSISSPGPIDNIIYVPTHNGKGTISVNNIGGDVDVKSIVDVDHYEDKLFAGLKTPKQYLGKSVDGGLSAGSSLTKLSSRYARTIKRIQNFYIQGITTLINIFALDRGFDDYVNAFTIKMVSPSTTEDQERDDTESSRLDIVDKIIALLENGDKYSSETIKDVLEFLLTEYLGESEINEILNKDKDVQNNEETIDEEMLDDEFSDSPEFTPSTPSPSQEFPINDTEFTNEETTEEFGDFSSEL